MGWPGPLTHLQYLVWQAWMIEDLWLPDRHDLYLMQLTREVFCVPARVFGGKTDEIKLTDFRLRPRDEDEQVRSGGKRSRQSGPSSQEPTEEPDQRPMMPGLPPVVTEANKDVIASKIAKAYRQYQRQLEQQGLLNNPRKMTSRPTADPEQRADG